MRSVSSSPTRWPRRATTSKRIGINGFGRIGRLVYRMAAEQGIEIVAVNDLVPADNLAYLLKYDTMHRQFMLGGKPAEVSATENSFTVNGKHHQDHRREGPRQAAVEDLGVDYVLESTGLFTDSRRPGPTSTAGAKRVLISAPTKSEPSVRSPRCAWA
jgi:glyceraldehyde 3-phosphate dehydrogenase